MTLAQAIALVWIQRGQVDERDAHGVATSLIQEIKTIKRDLQLEIRHARAIGPDRYLREVMKP